MSCPASSLPPADQLHSPSLCPALPRPPSQAASHRPNSPPEPPASRREPSPGSPPSASNSRSASSRLSSDCEPPENSPADPSCPLPIQSPPPATTSTSTRSAGNYHQPPSHQLNSPHHHHPPHLPPPAAQGPPLPHPSASAHHALHHPQYRLPHEEPRKIVGFKRKSSASPPPEHRPEHSSHILQPSEPTNRRTSSAWPPPPTHSPANHHLNQLSIINQTTHPLSALGHLLTILPNPSSQAYHHPSYLSNHPQNHKPPSSEACELVPSSLAGLLSNHPGPPNPSSTAPRQADGTAESSILRRDPNRSRPRPTINKPSTSQANPQTHQPSTPLSSASHQRPPSAEQQWSSHHRSSAGLSPQLSRSTMLSTLDPAETPTRSTYSKPSTPLTANQPLPERAHPGYGHPYRSENPHPAGSNDTHHTRSPAVYYHSYPTHCQPLHPQQHHSPVYPHDHRPELHLRTSFAHQASQHSSLSTPDGHTLPTQSPSRADPDSKHSYRHPHHQSPSYEHQFLHPSQNRPQHPDTSRPSPSISNSSLPYQASRPATSSSSQNAQHMSMSLPPQQIRHPHHVDSPTTSPDRPRLYQPEPRRITLTSPDLQLQLSPRHQNADLYPSQATHERLSQQAISSAHPLRSSHLHSHPSAHLSDDPHFSSPRQVDRLPEQLHSSAQGPPRHRSSRSTDLSNQPQPSRQPRPQPVYMHELSPRFQTAHGHPTQAESSFHRNENPRSHQSYNHEPEQSPRARFPPDRPAGDQARFSQPLPENITTQHATYLRREPLASPITMQHPSYPSPSQRQQLSIHYEYPQHPSTAQQRQPTQMEPPSKQILNSPDGRSRIVSSHPAQQESHQQKKNGVVSNHPRRPLKSGKTEKVHELSNAGNSQSRPQAGAHIVETQLSYADASTASSSSNPGTSRQKPSKSSPKASQFERPRSKGLPSVGPSTHPRPVPQPGPSTEAKKPKLSPLRRPSSPASKYPPPAQDKQKDAAADVSPESTRPKVARRTTVSNADRESSTEPSSTGDGADEVADDGVIRCICSVTTDDGFTIQCETCEVWQHAVCVNVPIDEVPEHYFCDRCDPSPERRKQLIQMASRAEQIQRQRLKKEADTRSRNPPADDNSVTPGSPSLSTQAGANDSESLVDSPAASIAMSRVSSGVCINESAQGEPSGQSPTGSAKGKGKATSAGHLDKLPTTSYPDNGLGLSGLQESLSSMPAPRIDASAVPKDSIPRKPGRKPTKFAQPKLNSSKQPLDQVASGSNTANVVETDHTASAPNGADADDRYEAWRYEYTPTLKDLYMDADVKSQVQQLITQYLRIQSLSEKDVPVGPDAEVPGQEVESAERAAVAASTKPLSTSTEPCKSPLQVLDHLTQTTDTPVKSQRAVPHAFASTQFLPVTMSELPPPPKLTIKAIPPSNINFFPSLATSPFCPTFSNSLNNSSTSSLPRLITHGVFSTQPISRGSYIASLKGSITSMKKYTEDIYNQYTSLGCNKPYVKFFRSTQLEKRLLRDPDSAHIDDGLVIDSRQYGNEMRFIRNGCHPNAFINIIMTPQAPRSHDPELASGPDLSRSATPSGRSCAFPTPGLDRHHHSNNLWSTADCEQPLPWEVSFGIFAASDISRREEIILPWEWDDQHLVHLLPRLLSHSSTFEAQQQRSPTLPPVRVQFLPWSRSDLKLLSCKLAAVTLTFFGLMFCGCERKKNCAVNLMWKIGCLSAGEPMFPSNQDGCLDSEGGEMTSISGLKERQESTLPLTFEERFRLVLYSFLEQPNPLPSKVGRNATSNASAPTASRQKKQKIDLGPLLGLRRDWWLHSTVQPVQTDPSRTAKPAAKKQKRPRSRSVFNRKPSVHKIRRVSDVGELRQPGPTVPNPVVQKEVTLPEVEPSQDLTAHPPPSAQTQQQMPEPEKQSSIQSQPNQRPLSHPSPSAVLPGAQQTNPSNDARVEPSSIVLPGQDTSADLPGPSNLTHLQHPNDVGSNKRASEDVDVESQVVPQLAEVSPPQQVTVDSERVSDPITRASEAHQTRKDDISPTGVARNQPDHAMEVQVPEPRESSITEAAVDLPEPPRQVDGPPVLPAEAPPAEIKPPSSTPEEGEVQEEEVYPEAVVEEPPTLVSPPGPSPGYQFPKPPSLASQPETFFGKTVGAAPVSVLPLEASHIEQDIDQLRSDVVPASTELPAQDLGPSPPQLASVGRGGEEMTTAPRSPKQDSPAMAAQHLEPGGATAAQPGPSQLATDDQNELPVSRLTPPSDSSTASMVQDSRQTVESVADLAADRMVADSIVSPKSPEPVHDVDTTQIRRIDDDEDHPETLQEAIRPSPEPMVPNQAVEQTKAGSPTRLSQRSASVDVESHLESQDDSALSQPSEGTDEHLLDSDASTTILGSSDEEMLSSHTPRYLNNRKRIRSKNILKPPVRMAPVKKASSARPGGGLPAGSGMTRLNNKPELRGVDKLKPPLPTGYRKGNHSNKTSSLSDLESDDEEEEGQDVSAAPAVKEPGSKMRLTIRSSSPSENNDDEEEVVEKTAGKLQRSDGVSPIPTLSSAADLASNSLAKVNASVIAQKVGRLDPVPASKSIAVDSSVAVPARTQETNPAMAVIEKQESEGTQPPAEGSSSVIERPAVAQLFDPPPQQCSASTSALEVNPPLPSPAEPSPVEPKKAAPKRISLKDYRSRQVTEPVVIAPLANPLIHFTTNRPPLTTVAEEPQRKQPPPPIPILPPLLPPSSSSQPLLPLSPRKLELVASVLKKEEKARAQSANNDAKIPDPLPDSPSPTRPPPQDIAEDRSNMAVDVVSLKKSDKQTALEPNIPRLNSELRQVKISARGCEEPVVGAYEDDIDGVAIESMSTPSDGEIDEQDQQRERLGRKEQVEMHGQETPVITSEKQDQAQEETINEVVQQVPREDSQPPDEEQKKKTPDVEKPHVEELDAQESQEKRPNGLSTTTASEDVEPPSLSEADRRPIRDAEITPPASNEPADQMEIDEGPSSNTVVPDGPSPPRLFKATTREDGNRPDHIPPPIKTERAGASTSTETAIRSAQTEDNSEEDMDISPIVVQHPPPPKPRLSIADYRRRQVRRPSLSEERHQSQSMSPAVPELELSRVNPQSSTASPQLFQKVPLPHAQRCQQESTSTLHVAADEARSSPPRSTRLNLSPLPPQQSDRKPNVDNVQPADDTVNAASESRPSATTMYFPPISPSILMGMESPRSPELECSPSPPGSPSEETSSGRGTRAVASCPPCQKSPSRTPLESTPVTSTSSLKGDLKPAITEQSALPRVAVDSSKLPGTETPDDRPLGQTASPAPESLTTQPPSQQLSASKSASTASSGPANIAQYNRPDPPKPSPSVHVASLPVPVASYLPAHQHRKPPPIPSGGGSQPTPIDSNTHKSRVQTPTDPTFPGPRGDHPAAHLPPSRSTMPALSSQRSPKIPLSPLAYKPSISPASSAPSGLSESRANPRGPSNISSGSSRDPPSRTLRVPSNSNSSRASWPPESAGPGHNDHPHHSSQGPSGGVHAPSTTSKSFSDLPPNPGLPPHPTHHAGAPPRNPPYHYPPHRGGPGFPPMRHFSGHRAITTPILGTSGPGPPGSFRQSQQSGNEGSERARYDGMLRSPLPSHHSSSYAPRGGRAKVRGGAGPSSSSSSYWPVDSNGPGGGGNSNSSSGGGSSGAGRAFGGPSRGDR
ncbi:hypothetical protein PtB15_1B396 [Puccinia triticina]|nr:hypothetical protein PtB15_1B396 [Puccinia triticina]